MAQFDVEFFDKFDAVVVSGCAYNTKVLNARLYINMLYHHICCLGVSVIITDIFILFKVEFIGQWHAWSACSIWYIDKFLPFFSQKAVNEKCRKRSKRVAFYAVECRGSCGEIFVDLQNHSYVQVFLNLSVFDSSNHCFSWMIKFLRLYHTLPMLIIILLWFFMFDLLPEDEYLLFQCLFWWIY